MTKNVRRFFRRFECRFTNPGVLTHLGLKMSVTSEHRENPGAETVMEWGGEAYKLRVLLHFDIRSSDERTRRRVDRFLYGCREVREIGGSRKVYRYPGLIERTEGRHYGQSVVILSSSAADEAFYFLRGMKVRCEKVEILAPDWV
ncbi:MAG: hypothetical protein E6K13_01070 [Methanobacteriota archaeon]|nr:MAG: hypothetical protein E6K13_01070 [Euryarchaeota archaeon]